MRLRTFMASPLTRIIQPRFFFINTFDSGAYRSDDGGKNWERLEGYNFKWGHRPIVDPITKVCST